MSQAGILDVENSNPQIPTSFQTDDGVAIPIANQLELLASVVPNVGVAFISRGSGNTVTYEIQFSNETAVSDATIVGLAAFDSSAFDVDANGFVTLLGGGVAATNLDVDTSTPPGTDPVVPDGVGNIVFTGAQVAAGVVGANALRTNSEAANTVAIEIQRSAAVGASDLANNGISHFNSSQFIVDGNGFVSLLGNGQAIDSIGVDSTSGGGTNPVLPTVAGLVTNNGAVVAAGTNPIRTVSIAANVYQTQVQISQAIAATDATKIGLCNFDSANFTVDANGFVSLTSSGGFTWNDISGAFSPLAENGYFVTGTATGTLPASPSQGDMIKFVVDHATQNLTIDAPGTQLIRNGTGISSAGGTCTSNNQGDSIVLVYRAANTTWIATEVSGTWTLA